MPPKQEVLEILSMSLYEITHMLAIQIDNKQTDKDYIQLKTYDDKGQTYHLKVCLEKER